MNIIHLLLFKPARKLAGDVRRRRITTLRDGELVASDVTSTFDRDKIIRAMVGRTVSGSLYRKHSGGGARRTWAQDAERPEPVDGEHRPQHLIFGLRRPDHGMFGLIGSGRTETVKIVAGAAKRNFFNGGEVLNANARHSSAPASGRGVG